MIAATRPPRSAAKTPPPSERSHNLTGCHYGIAVFEDIEERDYNPNVSLELGYLMGRGKRTLLLKEKHLPTVPTDVVHRLYKEFDGYDIENSIKREVGKWITKDLRI